MIPRKLAHALGDLNRFRSYSTRLANLLTNLNTGIDGRVGGVACVLPGEDEWLRKL